MTAVARETRNVLAEVAAGRTAALSRSDRELDGSGLDARVASLTRIAALIALDGPPTSYAGEVASAIEGGASPEDVLDVLGAVAGQVGRPRIIAAAAEIMLALDLPLSDDPEKP